MGRTLTGRVGGTGLPALLFLEMEGVLISSRFFRENIVPGGPSRCPQPLSARPPFLTAPVTFAGRSVRRARVAPPRFLIGSVARPETGKAEPASRSEAEARGTLAALRGHRGQRDPRTGGDV